jgi:hypothetical protein
MFSWCRYLEAQVHRNVAEDVVLLAPLAQEVLQFQGALEKEEEDADGISLDDGSSEEEEQEDEEGSDEEGSDGSVAERSRTLTDGAVTAPEAVELLEAAIAVVPDIEVRRCLRVTDILETSSSVCERGNNQLRAAAGFWCVSAPLLSQPLMHTQRFRRVPGPGWSDGRDCSSQRHSGGGGVTHFLH